LPYNLPHNLTIVDRGGNVVTAYLSPDRDPIFSTSPAATNHQGAVEWPEQARATRTLERERHILELLHDPTATAGGFADAFLSDALYSHAYERGYGTLYTAVFHPVEGRLEYRWPGSAWPQSFAAFTEGTHEETLAEGSVV
jgi:predicted choloylglycine hydrolase